MMVLAYVTLSQGYLISLCILLVMLLLFVGEPDPELKLSCRQRSSFLQNNYRDSSFKQLYSKYSLVNTGKERAKVSLIFYMGGELASDSFLLHYFQKSRCLPALHST
ncbi:hypothetical protein Bca4012_069767 [Brassica carinata]